MLKNNFWLATISQLSRVWKLYKLGRTKNKVQKCLAPGCIYLQVSVVQKFLEVLICIRLLLVQKKLGLSLVLSIADAAVIYRAAGSATSSILSCCWKEKFCMITALLHNWAAHFLKLHFASTRVWYHQCWLQHAQFVPEFYMFEHLPLIAWIHVPIAYTWFKGRILM